MFNCYLLTWSFADSKRNAANESRTQLFSSRCRSAPLLAALLDLPLDGSTHLSVREVLPANDACHQQLPHYLACHFRQGWPQSRSLSLMFLLSHSQTINQLQLPPNLSNSHASWLTLSSEQVLSFCCACTCSNNALSRLQSSRRDG